MLSGFLWLAIGFTQDTVPPPAAVSPPALDLDGASVAAPSRTAEIDIRYRLEPEGDVRSVTLTSVVPATIPGVQTVHSVELHPPLAARFERDGNSYVRFLVTKPTGPVELSLRVKLTLHPHDLTTVRNAAQAAKPELSAEERERYTRPERFIESDYESIRKLAERITGKSELERMRSGIDLALAQLQTGPFTGDDLGALAALRAHRGDCTDYSDLTTAILRAARIPTRRAAGYLVEYTQTPKHDWIEVFCEGLGWVPFDPSHMERGVATFDRLKTIYVRTSTLRNDDSLSGFHYYSTRHDGGEVKVRDEFEVIALATPETGK